MDVNNPLVGGSEGPQLKLMYHRDFLNSYHKLASPPQKTRDNIDRNLPLSLVDKIRESPLSSPKLRSNEYRDTLLQ